MRQSRARHHRKSSTRSHRSTTNPAITRHRHRCSKSLVDLQPTIVVEPVRIFGGKGFAADENPFGLLADVEVDPTSGWSFDFSPPSIPSLDRCEAHERANLGQSSGEAKTGAARSPAPGDSPLQLSNRAVPASRLGEESHCLTTSGRTSTLLPNLFSRPSISTVLHTIPSADTVCSPSAFTASQRRLTPRSLLRKRSQRPSTLIGDLPTSTMQLDPSNKVSMAAPPEKHRLSNTSPRPPKSTHSTSGTNLISSVPVNNLDYQQDHKLDVTGFLKLGHARNCWCGFRPDGSPNALVSRSDKSDFDTSSDEEDWVFCRSSLQVSIAGDLLKRVTSSSTRSDQEHQFISTEHEHNDDTEGQDYLSISCSGSDVSDDWISVNSKPHSDNRGR